MWALIDLIIIGIVFLCTFIGYKRGLIGVAFKIVSFFIAILVALLLSGPITNWIMNNTTISQNIENAIIEKFASEDEEVSVVEKEDINNTSQVIVDHLNKQVTEAKNTGVKAVAKEITESAIRIIVIIILYFATKLILFFFRAIAEKLGELPIIKQFNKLGGTIYGILKGVLIIYVLLAVLSLLAPMVNNSVIFEQINSSIIANFMYNNNIILNIIL